MTVDKKKIDSVKSELQEKNQRVTSYDVARAAGVSQSAVSRCFKDGASVSRHMREKVQKVADILGYQPNAIARSLITRRSNMVAVVINNDTNLYYPEFLTQLSDEFTNRGVHLLLFTLEHESEASTIINQVSQYQVDGVILAARMTEENLRVFNNRDIPVVYYNRASGGVPCNSVICDSDAGERLLVDKLLAIKRKRFCVISGPDDSIVSTLRTKGAISRLSEAKVKYIHVIKGDYSYESGYAALMAAFKQLEWTPDAIICANDTMAMGCLDAAKAELQLKVPEKLSIVGFDGAETARFKSYQLTTIAQPLAMMTQAAVEILMKRIEDPSLAPERRIFDGEFIEGNTLARLSR